MQINRQVLADALDTYVWKVRTQLTHSTSSLPAPLLCFICVLLLAPSSPLPPRTRLLPAEGGRVELHVARVAAPQPTE